MVIINNFCSASNFVNVNHFWRMRLAIPPTLLEFFLSVVDIDTEPIVIISQQPFRV